MRRYESSLEVLFVFYSLCFLGAAFNHARDIILGGFLPYRYAPIYTNIFWTSLTFVDPLVPLLIVAGKEKPALLLALAIMVTDVTVNSLHAHYYRASIFGGNIALLAQTAFLMFLLATVPIAWMALPSKA